MTLELWGFLGQWLTATIICCVFGYAVYSAIQAIKYDRQQAKAKRQEVLNGKIDKFTGEYGARSEDPEDQVPYTRRKA
jgi:hypothetical protein